MSTEEPTTPQEPELSPVPANDDAVAPVATEPDVPDALIPEPVAEEPPESDVVEPVAPVAEKESSHTILGAPSSSAAPLSVDADIEEVCRKAHSLKRGVSFSLQSPDDITAIEKLMDGHPNKVVIKVQENQSRRVILRTL